MTLILTRGKPTRCWRCLLPTLRTTRLTGAELGFCPAHMPDALNRFQRACFAALCKGWRRRHGWHLPRAAAA